MTSSRANNMEQRVFLPRSAAKSNRTTSQQPPLLRNDTTESTDDPFVEIPLPVAIGHDSNPIRILHVDDDLEISDVTATFLERINEDFTVVTEATVVGALNRLSDENVDCIVSDYDMPNTDGLDFLELVRERDADLPFILFTGKGSEEIASEAIAADVTDYMQKGVRPDQYEVLANRVENAVDQYRTQQQFWNALSWYQRLVEQELAGVLIVQEDEFVYVNEKLAEIFGYCQADLIGSSPLAIAADDRDEHVVQRKILNHGVQEGDTFRCSFTGVGVNGTEFKVDVHGGAVEYEGEPACIGILRNGTDRINS